MKLKNSLRILAITQARFSSSRLPGKILLKLGNKIALEHTFERLKNINNVDEVVCAIANENNSKKIINICKKNNVKFFLGSKNNVLERIYFASKKNKADIVLRVTSDCPLIDPDLCHSLIQKLIKKKLDYASNNLTPSFPHGLDCEVFTFKALEKAYRYSLNNPINSHLEHVTTYLKQNKRFKKENLKCNIKMKRYERWTLDTELDYKFLNKVFSIIQNDKFYYNWRKVLELIDNTPKLQNINNITHHFWF